MRITIKLLLTLAFWYACWACGGCGSSKKTQSSTAQSTSTVAKKDSTTKNVKKTTGVVKKTTTGVKSNAAKNKKVNKQKNTETTESGYDALKLPTPAADYFPDPASGIIKINDSLLLTPKKRVKKQQENKQTETNTTSNKDSTHATETTVLSTSQSQAVQVIKSDSTGTSSKTDSSTSTVIRFNWWHLIWFIPLLVVLIYFRKKIRSFVGFIS